MNINTTFVGLADARRLVAAIQACGVTAPERLADVLQAYDRLTQVPVRAHPA